MQQSTLSAPSAAPALPGAGTSPLLRALRRLASLRLTLVLLLALAVTVFLAYHLDAARTWPLAGVLGLLAANLGAAVATNGAFRRQLPLLVFHIALAILLLLVAAGRMTSLTGQVEVLEGGEFDGHLASAEAGPWHAGALEALRFTNLGFEVSYDVGRQRQATRNRVSWVDEAGVRRLSVIGDQDPLRLAGYRFYTTHNKGYAPVFRWKPTEGAAVTGAVHLPPYPVHEYGQAREWTPPGRREAVWILLDLDDRPIDPGQRDRFRLPERYRLVLRAGDLRTVLEPGESVTLPDGVLRFEGLKTWMGYKVFYDWTLPWLAAACAVAVASLAWHFLRRFAARPWDA